MHKVLLPIILIAAAAAQGCATLVPKTLEEKAAAAAEVGKFSTLVYHSQKDKIDPEGTIATVYKAFSDVLDETGDTSTSELFKTALILAIKTQVKDPAQQTLALGLVDIYWDRLAAKVNLNRLGGIELVVVLKAFKTGVEEMRAVIKGPR